METQLEKTVDEWLNEVDYRYLNNGTYKPSEFSLNFMNFVKTGELKTMILVDAFEPSVLAFSKRS